MSVDASSTPAMTAAPSIATVLAGYRNHGPGFDTVRLVAASSVALHHSLGIAIDVVHDDPIFQFSGGYTHLGLLSVAVFFSISGFLVTPGLAKNGNILEYLSRRFMRIMPLLVVVVVFAAFVLGPLLTTLPVSDYFASGQTWSYLQNITTSLQLTLPGVTNHHGHSGINNPLWTLRFEWLCYLIVAAASVGLLLRKRGMFLAAWLGVLLAYPLIYGFPNAEVPIGQVGMLLHLFSYFGAGVVISLYSDRIRWSPAILAGAVVALVIALWIGVAHLLAPFLVAFIAIGVGLVRMPWSTFLAKADLSYGMYLTHALVLTVLMHIFTFENPLALFAACLPITLLVAWLTWTYVEKPSLQHKGLPAKLVRSILPKLPLGNRLLGLLEPKKEARQFI